ncbi:MAG: DNA ligase [Deltaproteobacteria bacterium]|nr:DNA ligase [Deltaproteobacteria bacterium]
MQDRSIEKLAERLEACNAAYRSGNPLVSDREYDELVERLRELAPRHPFLTKVEPERFDGKIEIRHPVPMLSTEKAYSRDDVERFVNRVQKAAVQIGLEEITFRVTPKLDGLAGRDDGRAFVSRGNGETGYEISSAFDKGVVPLGGRGNGLGEIVVRQSYFTERLSGVFEHPRNMVVGIVSSDTVNEIARQALDDGVVHFVPYDELPRWEGSGEELLDGLEAIVEDLASKTDYPMDGVVAEAVDEELKTSMGATAHHHRWQIAIKSKGATAETDVEGLTWQVGRTGNVTPVMEVKPVLLSGATIRRVTAHHAGMVVREGLGRGAVVEIIRSGEVIPKLEKVIKPADAVSLPENCPVCATPLTWQNDFLRCTNPRCRAQVEQSISHWFKTLGNADWFGIKTIQKIVAAGFDSLEKIYALTEADFVAMGFGPVQSKNLAESLNISRRKPVEAWRFLAAFGIANLGKGDSRKLLSHISLKDLLQAEQEEIESINGFGGVTSLSVHQGIERLKNTIEHMLSLGFNLVAPDPLQDQAAADSAIAGKGIVFTGKMKQGSREEMQARARNLRARVQTSVSGKTDLLVCGEKVGAAKIKKAESLGVTILSEEAYLALIKP